MKSIVSTAAAPKAIGPYSQGVQVDGFFFFSGQIPIDPATGKLVPGGIAEQTEQALKNVSALLSSQNLAAKDVIKATVYLTDMNQFPVVNTVYGKYFSHEPPARSCVEVSRLPMGAAVEIEVIAKK
jgi:2-iminobutanoate/2-iminopropanoate deaminase